jgi:hypothetical protein
VFDKSARRDGTFSREEFTYDLERDVVCPAGKTLTTPGTLVNDGATLLYRASKFLKRPAERVVKSTAGAARRSSGSARARPRCAGRGCRALPSGRTRRLQLFSLAYNLANFLRTLALPEEVERWSLTTLREKLVKIGARIVRHASSVVFRPAEVAVPRALSAEMLRRVDRLRPRPLLT